MTSKSINWHGGFARLWILAAGVWMVGYLTYVRVWTDFLAWWSIDTSDVLGWSTKNIVGERMQYHLIIAIFSPVVLTVVLYVAWSIARTVVSWVAAGFGQSGSDE